MPRDSVYTYYKKYYTPNNMVMAIVGDINADTALNLVKRYFGSLPKGIIQKDQYLPPEAKPSQRSEIKRDVAQAYLMIGMIGPQASDPHNYAVDILADILGNGESSRLRRTLQNEKRLVNSISMSFDTRKYEGLIYVYATLDTANIQKVETAIKNIFSEIKEKGITEEELLKAKNSIKTNYYAGYEKGLDIADNYAQSESFIGYKFARDYPNNIERVSLAQVAAAARQYLQTDSYVLSLVVPK
ncbi:MAG: insulinase family protein [candidate division Zixibacteria bacterium]|nr:insulinase family protein [candidate division Zixibacteria bacterium]